MSGNIQSSWSAISFLFMKENRSGHMYIFIK
uniref:Uncharacterized protein n=1 Tax=Anguilla anguilla TaxID=7936 RepID=A0A0E9VXX7_ANGAN